MPTQPSSAGAEIDNVIGALDGFGIVLHHQYRVSQIAKPRQGIQQPVIIARVQPDGWLVQHIQHAAQFRADLRRQPDALRFAAGKGSGRSRQAQIIQAHGGEKLQPVADPGHAWPLGNNLVASDCSWKPRPNSTRSSARSAIAGPTPP